MTAALDWQGFADITHMNVRKCGPDEERDRTAGGIPWRAGTHRHRADRGSVRQRGQGDGRDHDDAEEGRAAGRVGDRLTDQRTPGASAQSSVDMRHEPRSDPMKTASPAHGRQYPDEGSREPKPPMGSAISVHPIGASMSDARQLPDYYCVKCEQRRTQGCFRRSCPGIPAHYVISDLERALATATRERDEARAEVAKLRVERDTLKAAAKKAEAALADIGDSDHEPTDDLAWCEQRAQEALPVVRFALAATEAP